MLMVASGCLVCTVGYNNCPWLSAVKKDEGNKQRREEEGGEQGDLGEERRNGQEWAMMALSERSFCILTFAG